MGEKASQSRGGLGFLDSLGRLFRGRQEQEGISEPAPERGFDKLGADFAAAIGKLNERIEEQRRASAGSAPGAASSGVGADQRAAERERRLLANHQAIRDDIEKMHVKLRTGISGADMDSLSDYLSEQDALARAGRDSEELIPRARYAIAQRLGAEAGELAVARLIALLQREEMDWPDPTLGHSKESPERIESSRRRRLADVRESFLHQDLLRTAERVQGIVRGWGADYPDRGTPLWEESVLEGVAAAIRGRMIRDWVEALQKDRELLLSRTEETVGQELAALHTALEQGAHTVDQARQAVASSLRVIDEVVPGIAWEIVKSRVPEARGEFPQP
jgi:hypothetical protein